MKLTVTNEERFALASWLVPASWSGDEKTLGSLLQIHVAFGLGEYRPLFGPNPVPSDHPLASAATKRDVSISDQAARAILQYWPGHGTPGALGPAKVALLQRLRKLAPVKDEKPAKEPG